MAETTPSDQEAMIDTMFILVFVLSISFCSVLDPLVLHPTHEPQTDAHLLECSGLSLYVAVSRQGMLCDAERPLGLTVEQVL